MKVYNRKEFLTLPAGTIYCKGKEWYFNEFCIKAQSWENDWVYLGMCWPDGKDSGECFDRLEDSLLNGTSYPCNSSYGRDGSFDDKDLFLVFEKDDLLQLKEKVEEALTVGD